MKKTLTLLLAAAALTLPAQNADERISTLINESQWFALQQTLAQTPRKDVNPMLYELATSLTFHHFNQPDSAIAHTRLLLQNYQDELGTANALNMAVLLSSDMARAGQYAQAADLMESLSRQVQAQGADSASVSQMRQTADQYRTYASLGSVCRPLHPRADYRLPLDTLDLLHSLAHKSGQHLLTLQGSLNRTSTKLVFDTGAGINIISSSDAARCGLRPLDTTISMAGFGIQQGQMAIADTLRMGDMTWINVPFFIVDMSTGNDRADSIGSLLPPVIGLPVMQTMQEIQFDFARRELLIPARLTPMPQTGPNLLLNDNNNLNLLTRDGWGNPVVMHLDTGGYLTGFNQKWYNQNEKHVRAEGVLDSIRMAGVGGVIRERTYRLPSMALNMGSAQATLHDVHVGTGLDLSSGKPMAGPSYMSSTTDGDIGLNLFEQFPRVILNLKDMYLEGCPGKP